MKIFMGSSLTLTLLMSFSCGFMEKGLQLNEGITDNVDDISAFNPTLERDYSTILTQEKDIVKNAPTAQINALAFNIYDQLKDKENISYSPMSISMAVAMAYAGAGGETKKEMQETLGYGADDAAVFSGYGNFSALLTHKNFENVKLTIANATWLAQGFEVLEGFQNKLKSAFSIKSISLDFKNEPQRSTDIINKSIAQQTNGKIDKLLKAPLDSASKMVLTNAIYFTGKWENQFEEHNTSNAQFFAHNSEEISTDYMNQVAYFDYAEDEEKQVVQANYEGKEFSMVFVLPKQGHEDVFAKKMTNDDFAQMTNSLVSTKVDFKLPKFTQRFSPEVGQIMQNIGMKQAFDEDLADFSAIETKEKLHISKIFHEAVVEVSEKGTTAAAATAIIMEPATTSIGGPDVVEPPVEFYATRPFMYYMIHKATNAIIFMGKYDRPQ
ncbi:MAG: serpin family protein [Myxococcales bacterium]|nr:serpin family protein [Myxococcales bacterium]USN51220.1 MAG: serpin family protein [Myxococcales bacterium]